MAQGAYLAFCRYSADMRHCAVPTGLYKAAHSRAVIPRAAYLCRARAGACEMIGELDLDTVRARMLTPGSKYLPALTPATNASMRDVAGDSFRVCVQNKGKGTRASLVIPRNRLSAWAEEFVSKTDIFDGVNALSTGNDFPRLGAPNEGEFTEVSAAFPKIYQKYLFGLSKACMRLQDLTPICE